MDHYARAYNQALKFAVLPGEKLAPFAQHREVGERDRITHSGVAADYLEESDDPRSDILRRHLGQTAHPEAETYDGPNQGSDMHVGHYEAHGGITFRPLQRPHDPAPTAVKVSLDYKHLRPVPPKNLWERVGQWWDGTRGHSYPHELNGTGVFTPEEARSIADKLHPHDQARVHALLDHHFGPRS